MSYLSGFMYLVLNKNAKRIKNIKREDGVIWSNYM